MTATTSAAVTVGPPERSRATSARTRWRASAAAAGSWSWLEDAGIPARVIDELMGHEASTRGAQHLGSTMGAHYRHTTPEMATRVVTAIQARLAVVVRTAEETLEIHSNRGASSERGSPADSAPNVQDGG